MGLRGLVVLASHTLPFFFSPFCARLAPRNVRGFSFLLFFRLERRGHGREQESVWNSRSIIALPTYPRIPFVSSQTRRAFYECVQISARKVLASFLLVLEREGKPRSRCATTREGARTGSVRVRDGGEIWAGMWAYCIYGSSSPFVSFFFTVLITVYFTDN